ncbi:MAG TPA: UDP-glucose/GDP-mannose dehydrogenase family protein [Candidatus Saccharimonadales bacterium]|nr:UDP-glucose/GDP-mannose dehydrogenase family protein [Candidatus Saccharimonadales bacterium]
MQAVQPTITILGTGYVGLTTGALTAMAGMKTYLVDPNPKRLDSVRAGKSFFYEEGLDPLVAEAVKQGGLIPTDSYAQAVPESDIVISSVGTPDNPDGSSNLTYIFAAATEAARHLKPGAIYVQKSTVQVGTGAKIKQIFTEAGTPNAYVSNPEFLRESTALADALWFDRIVVGGDDEAALECVLDVYRTIEQSRDAIAKLAGLTAPANYQPGRYLKTKLESAELIKVTSNAFLTLKISFANSMAMLADKVGADILEVMDGTGADQRIGHAFLNAGRGYGGGCFPKDVSGLIAAGLDNGVALEIMSASQSLNETMPGYVVEKLQNALSGSLRGRTVAVLGLSFKAGTSDARRSPGVKMANLLVRAGASVRAFDPKANEEAAESLNKAVQLTTDADSAVQGADAVVIATDWPELINRAPQEYAEKLAGTILVDAMNRFDMQAVREAGLTHIGVGRSSKDIPASP